MANTNSGSVVRVTREQADALRNDARILYGRGVEVTILSATLGTVYCPASGRVLGQIAVEQ